MAEAEREEIRQLYEVGTQVHVLEQMYAPDVVKAVVDEFKKAKTAASGGPNTDNNQAEQEKEMMENLLKAAEEAEAARAAAEAKMAAERNAAHLEEANDRMKEEAAALELEGLDEERITKDETEKAEREAAEKALCEQLERLKKEKKATEKREAEQKMALEKLAQEKESQERFIKKQKEVEEQEKARVAEEEEKRKTEEKKSKKEAEECLKEVEERLTAGEEAAKTVEERSRPNREDTIEQERLKAADTMEGAEKQKAKECMIREAKEAVAMKAASETITMQKAEEESLKSKAEEAAEKEGFLKRKVEEAATRKSKAERRLTSEIDEVEQLALDLQAELDKFGDEGIAADLGIDAIGKVFDGDEDIGKIDDVADQLAKEMQMEMDKLGLDDSKEFSEEDKASPGGDKSLLSLTKEEEMEIDFLAYFDGGSKSAQDLAGSRPPMDDGLPSSASIRHLASSGILQGKVSGIKGSIEAKTKGEPFIKADKGTLSSKQVSPSVRSKEVRVVPPFHPKSKAQKSADTNNPMHRMSDPPGKLEIKVQNDNVAAPAQASLPRVAQLKSSLPRIKARELVPTRPKSKSPRKVDKTRFDKTAATGIPSCAALPRVASLPSAVKPKVENYKEAAGLSSPKPYEGSQALPPSSLPRVASLPGPARAKYKGLPPRITSPPIIPPKQPRTPTWSQTLPRVLSPRDAPLCPTPYNPELHGVKGPCERCMDLSSTEEKEKYSITGHHLRIMVVSGGCDRSCLIYPRSESETPVRLCKKCYFDTHRTFYDALESPLAAVER